TPAHRIYPASCPWHRQHDVAGAAPCRGTTVIVGVRHGGRGPGVLRADCPASAECCFAVPAWIDRMSVIENAIKRLQASRGGNPAATHATGTYAPPVSARQREIEADAPPPSFTISINQDALRAAGM